MPDTPQKLDNYAMNIVNAIKRAIDETTPRKRPCPHSKRWWKPELSNLRKQAHNLRNKARRRQSARQDMEQAKAAWCRLDTKYTREITKAKTSKWREFVESTDDIWKAKKYLDNPAGTIGAFVPTLEGQTTHENKAKALQNAFFPQPPPANTKDITQARYPQEAPFHAEITSGQVRKAITKLAPNKAPGPDEISNRVLKAILPQIEHHLQNLMQASLNLQHFPEPFKSTTTIVLRKPNKLDYSKAKAYRPISLECTLGKVLESIIADIISYLTEMHDLLPEHHYGGTPGRSAEDAMMILSENIHRAWKDKEVYTAIFLDIAGTFNNVHHKRLIHNLRKRRILYVIASWIQSFLQNRTTKLVFNSDTTNPFDTPAGIPQGSPLSPLLYMYYNADLLDIPQAEKVKATALGFIDDIVYGVSGISDTGNARKLKRIFMHSDEWRDKHGAQFETSKYVLVHFTKNLNRETKVAITIDNMKIKPTNEAKYLGVIFDQKLNFKSHLQYVVKKSTSAAIALSAIAKSN